MNSQVKRYIGQDLEGSLVQELLSLWSWGVPLSFHLDMFTNSKTLQSFVFKSVYRALSLAPYLVSLEDET